MVWGQSSVHVQCYSTEGQIFKLHFRQRFRTIPSTGVKHMCVVPERLAAFGVNISVNITCLKCIYSCGVGATRNFNELTTAPAWLRRL
jgi:hypothetical protein